MTECGIQAQKWTVTAGSFRSHTEAAQKTPLVLLLSVPPNSLFLIIHSERFLYENYNTYRGSID